MKRRELLIELIASGALLSGCAAAGKSPSEKRVFIQKMRQDTLSELYKLKPSTRSQIQSAVGYAVFSNANVNLIFASVSGGYGVVRNSKTRHDTYMNMGEAGLGLGVGVKDFRAVFVFDDLGTLNRFTDSGWEFGAHTDAAAKIRDKGGAIAGEIVVDGITIYQLTEAGLALQATIKGTKYWKDEELN